MYFETQTNYGTQIVTALLKSILIVMLTHCQMYFETQTNYAMQIVMALLR